MSEKTAGGEKSAKQDKSETKSTPPSTSPDSTAASDSKAASDGAATPSEKSTKARAAADHSPSYFSSVSSAQYRARWDSIFSSAGKTATEKPRAKRKNGLPVTIALDPSDLDDEVRMQIEDAFRRKAKGQRITFDRFMKQARMTWRLECEFTE